MLWNWFWELNQFRRPCDGIAPITPRDILDWTELTGTIVRREEASILLAMDAAYRPAYLEEIQSIRARQTAKQTAKQK